MFPKDLIYAARALRKNSLFALTVLGTLALGIGISTAIFSVTDAVLLRPLPYRNPERLIVAAGEMQKRNVKDWPFSNADFFDLRTGTQDVFEDLAGVNSGRAVLPREDGSTEAVNIANVTTNFFRTLGGRIEAGRDFADSDGQTQPPPQPGSNVTNGAAPPLPRVVILSHEYFERRYGGDRSVVGKLISSPAGFGLQVVGVLAPGFELLLPLSANSEPRPDLWVAARLAYDNSQRNSVSLQVIGRLKNGVPLDRAQAAADKVTNELRRDFPIHNTSGFYIRVEPMRRHLVAAVQPAILALMGAVVFLLLIACANVANLMLVRMSTREREFAIRASLGGNLWRLVRQTCTESLLLAGVGSLLGLGLAWLGIHELLAIGPANLPRLDSIKIDGPVLIFTALAGFTAALIFGIAPTLRAARPDLMNVLRGSSRTAGMAGGSMLRNLVVVAEIALCFVLLIGSGLMLRSFLSLQKIDPGFNGHDLLVFQLLSPGAPTSPDQRQADMNRIHERLSAIPGVQSVTAAAPFPLTGNFSPIRWGTGEALSDFSKFKAVDFQIVLPGYFEAMGTRLIAGSAFTEQDNTANRNTVVVDQSLASKAFPFETAVGKRILIRIRTPEPEWVQIIGVVAHQRAASLAEAGREQIFFTDGFIGHGAANWWALRTSSNSAGYGEAVRKELAKINSKYLIARMQPMDKWIEDAQAGTRFSLLLIGLFATIAALLAAVGLYGVLSSVVRQRTAEIGVRMALGARPTNIVRLVVGNGLRLSAIGVLLGIGAALLLTHVMVTMLVGVKADDPVTFLAMTIIFLVVAAFASWLPARRASALDPTAALRES